MINEIRPPNLKDTIKVDLKYLKKFGITAEKRIHNGWVEHQQLIKKENAYWKQLSKDKPLGYFHKWQFIFTSEKGRISLVRLLDYYRLGEHQYEIFCLDEPDTTPAKRQLDDVRRFYKREDAVKCVIDILRIDK